MLPYMISKTVSKSEKTGDFGKNWHLIFHSFIYSCVYKENVSGAPKPQPQVARKNLEGQRVRDRSFRQVAHSLNE